jgi:hypothetical protein
MSRGSEQYNGRQYTWTGTSTKKTFDVETTGDIEIFAKLTMYYTAKQLMDYPCVTTRVSNFTAETTSSFNAPNGTVTITKSGIIITDKKGGKISSVGDNIMMTSPNDKYGIKVTDEGVMIKKDGVWSTL